MTENQAKILDALSALRREDKMSGQFYPVARLGARPGSHHTVTCARMVPLGWIERENIGQGETRPRWGYRVMPQGRQALANHVATKGMKA